MASLDKGSLDKAIQELLVEQLTLKNKGSGSNPYLISNSTAQQLNVAGYFQSTNRLRFQDGTNYYAQLTSSLTANRTITLPDSNLTVAGKDINNNFSVAQNMIGLEIDNDGHINFARTSIDYADLKVKNSTILRLQQNADGSVFLYNHLIPNDNITYDLGNSSKFWNKLFVQEIEINNQSTGSNSIISSNSTLHLLQFNGKIEVNGSISLKGNSGVRAWLTHNNVSERTITFQDKSYTVGDQSEIDTNTTDIADNKKVIAKGSTNGRFITLTHGGTSGDERDCKRDKLNDGVFVTLTSMAYSHYFDLPLLTYPNDHYLNLSAIELRVIDADANNYIDYIKIMGIREADGVEIELYTYDTNITSAQKFSDTFTAIDVRTYESIYVEVRVYNTSSGNVKYRIPRLKYYYSKI